jgi:hypothetical protein
MTRWGSVGMVVVVVIVSVMMVIVVMSAHGVSDRYTADAANHSADRTSNDSSADRARNPASYRPALVGSRR